MSNVYLIRHGQAGTRDAYDSLSALGAQQAKLLGEYFAAQGIRFARAYSGDLRRQRETADAVSFGYGKDAFPEIASDPAWNEFDLERLYRDLAPLLSTADPAFRTSYEAMRKELHESTGAAEAPVRRRWMPCDTALVEAWIRGQHSYAGESWRKFCQRVTMAWENMNHVGRFDNIAIFTSATPIAISTARCLHLSDQGIMKLAAVLHNASFTLLQFRDKTARMFNFNAAPHLPSPELRTFR